MGQVGQGEQEKGHILGQAGQVSGKEKEVLIVGQVGQVDECF